MRSDVSEDFIIIRLQSLGLGNAFFQYAAARALAIPRQAQVLFDLSGCLAPQMSGASGYVTAESVRQLFAPFAMQYDLATIEEIRRCRRFAFQTNRLRRKAVKLLEKVLPAPAALVRERIIHGYQSDHLALEAPLYLEGTFINPRYFETVQTQILAELQCTQPLPMPLDALAIRMAEENSVAVHIRRGDYTHSATGGIYPVMDDAYARRAVDAIESRVGPVRCYVFSDDIEWARLHLLQGRDVEYVSGPGREPWMDLELMTTCRHHVISNSTFSWWAATRNRCQDGLVVCPTRWRNDAIDTRCMIMPSWIAL